MSITEKEKILFEKWAKNRQDFVKDGVVYENSYLQSNPRLLFVMKEVNDSSGGNWDLRDFIREGAIPQTWNNIARWVYGIRNLDKEINWDFLKKNTNKLRKEILNSICVMNLKKSPGRGRTNNDELEKIATEDKEYLKEQFPLYDPDLIICCGSVTGDLFRRLILSENNPVPNLTKRGIPFYEFKPNKYLISFYHPQATVLGCLLYYGLIDAVKEIWKHVEKPRV